MSANKVLLWAIVGCLFLLCITTQPGMARRRPGRGRGRGGGRGWGRGGGPRSCTPEPADVGDRCRFDDQCVSGNCKRRVCRQGTADVGDDCMVNEQCASNSCLDDACQQGDVSVGNPCMSSAECASNNCQNDECQQGTAGIGDSCRGNDECATGNCLNGECERNFTAVGDPCTSNEDCASNSCVNDACQQGNTSIGGSCQFDDQCAFDNCRNGTCEQGTLGFGETCEVNEQCGTGICDTTNGTCLCPPEYSPCGKICYRNVGLAAASSAQMECSSEPGSVFKLGNQEELDCALSFTRPDRPGLLLPDFIVPDCNMALDENGDEAEYSNWYSGNSTCARVQKTPDGPIWLEFDCQFVVGEVICQVP